MMNDEVLFDLAWQYIEHFLRISCTLKLFCQGNKTRKRARKCIDFRLKIRFHIGLFLSNSVHIFRGLVSIKSLPNEILTELYCKMICWTILKHVRGC